MPGNANEAKRKEAKRKMKFKTIKSWYGPFIYYGITH